MPSPQAVEHMEKEKWLTENGYIKKKFETYWGWILSVKRSGFEHHHVIHVQSVRIQTLDEIKHSRMCFSRSFKAYVLANNGKWGVE